LRLAWLVAGDIEQLTGGYLYDRLVVEGLRDGGCEVRVFEPLEFDDGAAPGAFDAVVGDALFVREIGPIFERVARGTARLLLVHHFGSWECERLDREEIGAFEARAMAASDRLVVTGHATAARVAALATGHGIDVVVPGADRLACHPRRCRNGDVIDLISVGSSIPRKRIPVILDAIERIGHRPVRLTVFGDHDRDSEHARQIAQRVGGSEVLRARVVLAGPVDDDALARAMADADALVIASSLEGYGIALGEALHAGLGVLASRPTAIASGIGGEAVFVFDDALELAEAIRRYLDEPGLSEAASAAARRTTLPRWADTVASFREAINRAVSAARARAPDRARAPR